MSDINKEIEQTAEKMEKSTKTPKEILFETIRQLGPDGIKAKLPSLEKSEKELLIATLEEMKKAVEMDKDYSAKFVQGKLTDTKIQEDKADDDQDEKLMKPDAAKFDHQGTPTPGWEGQVIKGKEPKPPVMGQKMPDPDSDEEKDEKAKKDKKDKPMKKSDEVEKAEKMAKKQGVPEGVDPAKQERCVRKLKGEKGKNAYAICNASMKKGEPLTPEVKAALGEIKKSVEEQLKEFGVEATPALIKAEMKRLLQEEDQDGDAPEMNEATRAKKENVEALNHGADNKAAQKKVNDEKQGQGGSMKKTVWAGENDLLKANTGGRNHHFSLEEYVAEVLKEAGKPEDMSKSQPAPKKDDLNEIIAKGEDASWDEVNCDRLVKANNDKVRGKFVKSFEDNEIAQALGLTPEEAKKILGE